MLHIRKNDYKSRGYCAMLEKHCQIVLLLGVPFYATVHNVVSYHCGKLVGRVQINGSWQKVRQVARGVWEPC